MASTKTNACVNETFRIESYKYDGSLHRTWEAKLTQRDGSLLVFDAIFDTDVDHALLGQIARGTHSLEYYWLDRWYNVFRFGNADGKLRNYYCNVNVPPRVEGNVLSYVDLDLDILVAPDLSYQILDNEDFARNTELYGYPDEVVENARQAVEELTELIEHPQFPFDP